MFTLYWICLTILRESGWNHSFMVLFFLSVKPYNQKKYLGTLLVTTHKLLHLNQHQAMESIWWAV